MITRNEPAFPVENLCNGLTKREYMATKMMAAIVSDPSYSDSYDVLAKLAVQMADALITELNKP